LVTSSKLVYNWLKIRLELLKGAASGVSVEGMGLLRRARGDPLAICVEAAVDSGYCAVSLEGKKIKYFLKYSYFLFLLLKA
jgi:hypothetical protein